MVEVGLRQSESMLLNYIVGPTVSHWPTHAVSSDFLEKRRGWRGGREISAHPSDRPTSELSKHPSAERTYFLLMGAEMPNW